MNRNLYSKELKRNKRSLAVWSSIVIGLTILVMSIFPYMKGMSEEMANMMSKMPEGMAKAMGLNEHTWDSILGMYNTYYGIYIIVLLSIYSSSTGATIISKEEKDKTAEFLLTKPISRKSIFVTKLSVLFTLTFTAFFLQTITAVIFAIAFEEGHVQWSVFTTMHTHGLILTLFFTCVGLTLSMFLKPKKNFMGMTVGIVFGSYFLNTIAKAAETVSWVGYISPFHYLDFAVTNSDYGINFVSVGIILFISMILLATSYKVYEKKDIST